MFTTVSFKTDHQQGIGSYTHIFHYAVPMAGGCAYIAK